MKAKRPERRVPAGEFEAKGLALLDEVAERCEPFVVTKRGRPVARVVPIGQIVSSSLHGSVLYEGDIVAPIGETWDAEG